MQTERRVESELRERMIEEGRESQPYDPYRNPPDLALAEMHHQANSIGTHNLTELRFCPCCDKQASRKPLSLCCKDEQLVFLGVGHALYFKIAKYAAMLLCIIFLVSGSALYFLRFADCTDRCLTILGIPVANLDFATTQNELITLATALCIFAFVLYFKTIVLGESKKMEESLKCPSNYTVMLQNVPEVEDWELREWAEEVFGSSPILLNYAYDTTEINEASRLKQKYTIQLNELKEGKPTEKDISSLQSCIAKQDQLLRKHMEDRFQCRKVGTVFATFSQPVRALVQQYQCSFLRSFLHALTAKLAAPKLYLRGCVVILSRAPAPRQIIWDNLQFSYIRSLLFELVFVGVMVILMMSAFKMQFYVVSLAYSLKKEGQATGKINLLVLSSALSLIILLLNCVMRVVIQLFTAAKKYYSHTKQQASFCLYYSIFYIINACIMVYVVHGQSLDDSDALLLVDIHLIMLSSALSQPVAKLIDPLMWYRIMKKRYISRLQKSPYTQEYANKAYEGIEVSEGDNYQYVTRTIFITTWFAHMAPIGVLVSLLGLALDYWIWKYLLLRVCKEPQNISERIALPLLMSMDLLPLVYLCGVLQFSYKVSSSQNVLAFLLQFMNYGVTALVALLAIVGYTLFCSRDNHPVVQGSYEQNKLLFSDNYETCNPITKLNGDINYLYEAMKSSHQEQSQRIGTLIRLARESIIDFDMRRQEVSQIKMRSRIRAGQRKEQEMIEISKV